VVALAEPAARGCGEAQLLLRLDPLGHDVHAQARAERRDRAHDRGAGRIARHPAQERAVDFEHLHRQLAQARERGMLRAEIIEREHHAELVQPLDHAPGAIEVVHRSLADLDQHLARRQRVTLERGGHTPGVALVAQLARRCVDSHPGHEAELVPGRRLAAGCLEHPFSDARDQARLLGVRQEAGRRHEAGLGILPANERLDAEQPACREVVHRLVVEDELLLGQRAAQPGCERELAARLAGVVGVQREVVAPAALGLVHGCVGVLEDLGGGAAVARPDRDADRGADPELGAVDHQRGVQRLEDPGTRRARRVGSETGADQHELVAAKAREQVAAARDRADPLGDLAQHPVAGGVSERVVDELELVEIDVQRRDRATVTCRACELASQLLLDARPVREAGQRVVEREVGQALLGLLPV